MARELHIFDFDGTLFRSPDAPPWWPDSWIISPASLGRPCVPDKPGPDWWDMAVVGAAKASCSDPDVYAVMLTGRPDGKADFRWRIPELLGQAGLRFAEVRLNPGGDTDTFKARAVVEMLRRVPGVKAVRMWDDDLKNLARVARVCQRLGLEFFPTRGSGARHAISCQPEDVRDLIRQGWLSAKYEKYLREDSHRVAVRWVAAKAEG